MSSQSRIPAGRRDRGIVVSLLAAAGAGAFAGMLWAGSEPAPDVRRFGHWQLVTAVAPASAATDAGIALIDVRLSAPALTLDLSGDDHGEVPTDGAQLVFECAAQTDQRIGDGATRVYLEFPEAVAQRACGGRGDAGPACLQARRLVVIAGTSAEPPSQRVQTVFSGETRGLRDRPADDNVRLGVRASSANGLYAQKSALASAIRERLELGAGPPGATAMELTVFAEAAADREMEAEAARAAGGWSYLDRDRRAIERSLAHPFLASYGFSAEGASAAFLAFDRRCAQARIDTLAKLARLREFQVQARVRSGARSAAAL